MKKRGGVNAAAWFYAQPGFHRTEVRMDSLAKVTILRASGAIERHEVGKHILSSWITRMIGAEALDCVDLRDGKVMLVDDTGLVDGKPENAAATKLYHSVCRPGTTDPICGDVAVALDEDFA